MRDTGFPLISTTRPEIDAGCCATRTSELIVRIDSAQIKRLLFDIESSPSYFLSFQDAARTMTKEKAIPVPRSERFLDIGFLVVTAMRQRNSQKEL
jgi:hypothetical protein